MIGDDFVNPAVVHQETKRLIISFADHQVKDMMIQQLSQKDMK
jgi:hypothetical protein